MAGDFGARKQVILGGLIVLLLADVALAAYSWQLASAPQTSQAQRLQEARQLKLLQADIDRAQKIRMDIPNIQKDCEQFEHSLFPASAGYSSVTSELGEIARKSGVRLEDMTSKQVEIESRKMTEVTMDATVGGDYKKVIEFLNGVQRSKNVYSIDALTLASENASQNPGGPIKVAVHLRTYFRTAA
jgi:Tfp pilus assembly protein PilO